MSYPPTAKQQAILRYVAGFIEAHGVAPTYDEMEAGTGAERCRIHDRITALEERGWITRLRNVPRAIELLRPVAIPRAPDGSPLHFVSVP